MRIVFDLVKLQIEFDKLDILCGDVTQYALLVADHSVESSIIKLNIFSREYFETSTTLTYDDITRQYFIITYLEILAANLLTLSQNEFIHHAYIQNVYGTSDLKALISIHKILLMLSMYIPSDASSTISDFKSSKSKVIEFTKLLKRPFGKTTAVEVFSSTIKHIQIKLFGFDIFVKELHNCHMFSHKLQLGRLLQSLNFADAGYIYSCNLSHTDLLYLYNQLQIIGKQSFIDVNINSGSDEIVFLNTINSFSDGNYLDIAESLLSKNYITENKDFMRSTNIRDALFHYSYIGVPNLRKINSDLLAPHTPDEFTCELIFPVYPSLKHHPKGRICIPKGRGLGSINSLGRDIRNLLVNSGYIYAKHGSLVDALVTSKDVLSYLYLNQNSSEEYLQHVNPKFIDFYKRRFGITDTHDLVLCIFNFFQAIRQRYEMAWIQQCLNDFSNVNQFLYYGLEGTENNALLNLLKNMNKSVNIFQKKRGMGVSEVINVKFKGCTNSTQVLFTSKAINQATYLENLQIAFAGKTYVANAVVYGIHVMVENNEYRLLSADQILQLGGIVIQNISSYSILLHYLLEHGKSMQWSLDLLESLNNELALVNINKALSTELIRDLFNSLCKYAEVSAFLRNRINTALFYSPDSGLYSNFVVDKNNNISSLVQFHNLELTGNVSRFTSKIKSYNRYNAPSAFEGIISYGVGNLKLYRTDNWSSHLKSNAAIIKFLLAQFKKVVTAQFNPIYMNQILVVDQKVTEIKLTDKTGTKIKLSIPFKAEAKTKSISQLMEFSVSKLSPQSIIESIFTEISTNKSRYPYLSLQLSKAKSIADYNNILQVYYEKLFFAVSTSDKNIIRNTNFTEISLLLDEISTATIMKIGGSNRSLNHDGIINAGGQYHYIATKDEAILAFIPPFSSSNPSKLFKLMANSNSISLKQDALLGKQITKLNQKEVAALNLLINRYRHIDESGFKELIRFYKCPVTNLFEKTKLELWRKYILDMYQVIHASSISSTELKKLRKIRHMFKYTLDNSQIAVNKLLLGTESDHRLKFNAYHLCLGEIRTNNHNLHLKGYLEILGQLDYLILFEQSSKISQEDVQYITTLWQQLQVNGYNISYSDLFPSIIAGTIDSDYKITNGQFASHNAFFNILAQNFLPPGYVKTPSGEICKIANVNDKQVKLLLNYGLVQVFCEKSNMAVLINQAIEYLQKLLMNGNLSVEPIISFFRKFFSYTSEF